LSADTPPDTMTRPRFSGDLDILVHPDAQQIGKMLQAFTQFGFPAQDLAAD
jgi:hypothetical protein